MDHHKLIPFLVPLWQDQARARDSENETLKSSIAHVISQFPVMFKYDLKIGRVAILLPTAGENLEVVFKALVGSLSQRLWDSGLPGSQTLRVVVLDEKRRVEVYRVAAGVHRIGVLLAGRRVQQILMVRVASFTSVLRRKLRVRKFIGLPYLNNVGISTESCGQSSFAWNDIRSPRQKRWVLNMTLSRPNDLAFARMTGAGGRLEFDRSPHDLSWWYE